MISITSGLDKGAGDLVADYGEDGTGGQNLDETARNT